MRLNEAAHLKISDIDSPRMQIRIVSGKGGEGASRSVAASQGSWSPRLLNELREYWLQYRPTEYLFPGRTPDVPFASTTIQKVCKAAAGRTADCRLELPLV